MPTSALCRRWAEKSRADWDVRGVDVGITRAVVAIVVLLVVGEGGDDGQAGEQGVQGVDDGAVGSVRGGVSAELQERGYTPLTTVASCGRSARLSRWLDASGLSAAELSVERVEQFLVWQRVGWTSSR